MNRLRFTLVAEGSSDRMLLPILHWLLSQHYEDLPLDGEWADLARLPNPPRSLEEKIVRGIQFYPCDLLFIHRDADNKTREERIQEIDQAIERARMTLARSSVNYPMPRCVCVIPVRMSEAWLLFDIDAIRYAASNPNGTMDLQLPALQDVERLPNPKELLYLLLSSASGLSGRALKRFKPQVGVHRIAGYIQDFTPLHRLDAFQVLNSDIQHTCTHWRWAEVRPDHSG